MKKSSCLLLFIVAVLFLCISYVNAQETLRVFDIHSFLTEARSSEVERKNIAGGAPSGVYLYYNPQVPNIPNVTDKGRTTPFLVDQLDRTASNIIVNDNINNTFYHNQAGEALQAQKRILDSVGTVIYSKSGVDVLINNTINTIVPSVKGYADTVSGNAQTNANNYVNEKFKELTNIINNNFSTLPQKLVTEKTIEVVKDSILNDMKKELASMKEAMKKEIIEELKKQ